MENLEAYIEINPRKMLGKPVIKGTRITAELILEKLAAGETMEQILQSHPTLSKEGIFAALQYAANSLRVDYVFPIAS